MYHALASDHIPGACGHAIVLGKYLSDKLLYSDQLRIQQQVAERINEVVIEAAIEDQNVDIATLFNDLGFLLTNLGDAEAAIEQFAKALQIYQRIVGEQHEFVAASYNNRGAARRNLGDAAQAIEYYKKALEILLSVYGEKHPNFAISYCNLGLAWKELGDATQAIEYLEKALNIFTAVYGKDHPTTKKVLDNLSSLQST